MRSFENKKLIELKFLSFGLLMISTVIFPQINIQEYFSPYMLGQVLVKVLNKLDKDLDIAWIFNFVENG